MQNLVVTSDFKPRKYDLLPVQQQNNYGLVFGFNNSGMNMTTVLTTTTAGRSAINLTEKIAAVVAASSASDGVAHLFLQHTSASLLIQENADADVMRDLLDWLDRLAPQSTGYRHDAEGADDMPAHLKAAITATSLSAPFAGGRLLLGTWQGIYLLEHRRAPQERRLVVTMTAAV